MGEQSLYIAIITQAFMDLNSKSSKPEDRYAKTQAIHWLLHDNKDFVVVCLAGGLDPGYVRMKARILKEGFAWRAASGKGTRYDERRRYREKLKR